MDKTNNRLVKWFQLASLAPSAANVQPWSYRGEFTGDEYRVFVKIDPEFLAHPSTLDPYYVTATIAIGCFVQNLEVAANLDGFVCHSSEIFGETAADWQWSFVFKNTLPTKIKLFCTEETLYQRVSNRTLYQRTPIESADLDKARNLIGQFANVTMMQIGSHSDEWKNLLVDLESIRLKEDVLRYELFQEFKTQSEIENEPVGLPIDTTSNSLFQRSLLLLMKKIPFFQWPLKFGAGKLFSWLSLSRPLHHSGELFALQMSSPDPRAGLELGKGLEGLWLLWTSLGYSVQVIALPILIYGNREGLLGRKISASGKKVLESVQQNAQRNLNMDLTLMTVFLRVGRASKSTVHSPRRKVVL